mmetsp:Transcript_12886/g.54026  ORF Transcript_12886/g.54026 Transcript_12886/m.54026 type:complete len:284 (+) Transcript_12886:443-1294(+)
MRCALETTCCSSEALSSGSITNTRDAKERSKPSAAARSKSKTATWSSARNDANAASFCERVMPMRAMFSKLTPAPVNPRSITARCVRNPEYTMHLGGGALCEGRTQRQVVVVNFPSVKGDPSAAAAAIASPCAPASTPSSSTRSRARSCKLGAAPIARSRESKCSTLVDSPCASSASVMRQACCTYEGWISMRSCGTARRGAGLSSRGATPCMTYAEAHTGHRTGARVSCRKSLSFSFSFKEGFLFGFPSSGTTATHAEHSRCAHGVSMGMKLSAPHAPHAPR